MAKTSELRLPALEIRQGQNRLYSFAVDGKQLHQFSTISRVKRGEKRELQGYQRPEVLSHISSIRRYLESDNAMLPNALVIAFDSRVRFEPYGKKKGRPPMTRAGELFIPLNHESDADKPGWIVDGQQRAAAIRDARVDRFLMCVTAFITDDENEQRAQFILVNSTKPLPKGLIYELLPSTSAQLPIPLQQRQFPAHLLERLNLDEESPLCGLIRTPTSPDGVMKDNSVLKMLENSLSDGTLYRFRNPMTGRGDSDEMLDIVESFWQAVKETFSDAWGLPPRKSRLMHGVGIVSLGFIMDVICDRYWPDVPTVPEFRDDLNKIAPLCAWTGGFWKFGRSMKRRWNELQNTPRDIQLLTDFLLDAYNKKVWSKEERAGA